MGDRILYLVMVVAAGWAVTFALRSLPFLIFAGKNRELPGWVEKLGNIVSPVIIGGLIVYSYATLNLGGEGEFVPAWRTVWPYLAGLLTVGLQLWRRNPLVSIIAGTALYMFLVAGCRTTEREIEYGAEHPLVAIDERGVRFDGEYVGPETVPERLEEYGVGKKETIHISVDPTKMKDMRPARLMMVYLARCGWSRSMLVTGRHAESEKATGRRRSAGAGQGGAKPRAPAKIRYKRANE